MSTTQLNVNVGTIYVTEMSGCRKKVYKVGRTNQPAKTRIAAPSAYAPSGVRVLIAEMLCDYDNGETMVHGKLAPWHCPPDKWNGAEEMFAAHLETIREAISEVIAFQKPFALSYYAQLEILKANGFLLENPKTILDEILQAPIARDMSLKSAVIRAINSTSNEDKALGALASQNILVDRKKRIAVVHCKDTLRKLCKRKSDASGVAAALSKLVCFNSHGNPIFA